MNLQRIIKSDVFVFILFLLIFYSLFRLTESFNKGYDITEEHILIHTNESLESNSLDTVFEKMMRAEFNALKRFRPVWVIYMMTTVKLFKVNLLLINIYIALICICTSFLLYKFSSNIGFSRLQSILFALLTLIGPATVLYIRPIDNEIIGMFALSVTLYFLSKSIYSEKHILLFKICFLISLIVTMLCKESFLILSPALLLLYFWLYSIKNKINFFSSIRKNSVITIFYTVAFIIIFYAIIKIIGINQDRSYSGVDIKLFSGQTFLNFAYMLFTTNIFLVSVFGIFIFFDSELQNHKLSSEYLKRKIRSLSMVLLFMFLVIIPQFILYYKTGFTGRYYLPLYLGFSFLLIYTLKIIYESNSISKFIKYFYLTTIVIYLLVVLKTDTIPAIVNFSKKCKSTDNVAKSIVGDKDEDLLIVFDPIQNYWDVHSLDLYLDYLGGQKDYKYDLVKVDKLGKLYSDSSFLNRRIEVSNKFINENKNSILDSTKQHPEINNILVLDNLNTKFLEKNSSWFSEERFDKSQFGNYTFYSKKSSY